VMVTGDHAATAVAIAQQVGIARKGDHHVVTGAEVERLDQADLEREAVRTRVFARVTPHAKLRLVQAYQSLGHVVAMTGDGVNDAPALRQAHIGVAMGAGGTDIAREAADMVLADDNFASIEAAVEEGRAVFENIQKFIVWALPTNLAEGFVILVAVMAGLTLPVLPAQILWINMATAVFLGLALAFEPPAAGLMQRPPRRPNSPIIPFRAVERISVGGGLLIASVFVTFEVVAAARSDEAARTAAATAIVLGELALLFNSRSLTGGRITPRLFLGRWVLLGSATMIAAQAAFIYAPPMQALFRTEAMGIEAWALSAGFAVLIFLVVEVHKLVRPGWLQVAKPPD
jgi:cation-transporting ATPase F